MILVTFSTYVCEVQGDCSYINVVFFVCNCLHLTFDIVFFFLFFSYLNPHPSKKSKFLFNMFKLPDNTTLSGNSFQLFMTICEKLNCL